VKSFDQDGHLKKVSRSFAACIGKLDEPLRKWVGLTYLACRVLDTVEDAPWSNAKKQNEHFESLEKFLLVPPTTVEALRFGQSFPEEIPDVEKRLASDVSMLFTEIQKAPAAIKKPIQELVLTMARGMRHFVEQRQGTKNPLQLKNLQEVNAYCFFVAGLVGEGLSRILAAIDSRICLSKELILNSYHFGLFLQKVNILKDQAQDEKEGRFLVPERIELAQSALVNAKNAMDYVRSLPRDMKGYRVFCLWSLFLGIKSLTYYLRQNTVEQIQPMKMKIPRWKTIVLFYFTEIFAATPWVLDSMFARFMSDLEKEMPEADSQGNIRSIEGTNQNLADVIKTHYHGLLNERDLSQIGLN
jgi:farnesyl-diphosphate farnesyltransferase